jgi:protease-4
MVSVIEKDRKLDRKTVEGLIDTGLFASEQAKAAKLVDEVSSFETFRGDKAWTTLELDGNSSDKLTGILKIWRFLGAMPPERPLGEHVAVIYAIGNIVDGDGDGVLGARQEIASHTLVAAIRALTHDDAVKAVVLRIDSGGGSAQASELIWRAVNDLKAKKPVIVSMSDVAASGGYYIASNATRIYALDNTLTGSIGVVGGKIAPGNALAKLGVSTFPRGRGRNATILARFSPWSDDEKQVIQRSMEEVYAVFTGRVADGRKLPIEKVRELAQGRVWTGTKAKELGLVDEIGGLDVAIAKAQELGKVSADTDLEIYPPSPTLRDVVQGWGGNVSAGLLGSTTELAQLDRLDPQLGAAAHALLDLVTSFARTHVQTITILPMVR